MMRERASERVEKSHSCFDKTPGCDIGRLELDLDLEPEVPEVEEDDGDDEERPAISAAVRMRAFMT